MTKSILLRSRPCFHLAWVVAILVASAADTSLAGFTLVDDFESYTTGSAIDGQGNWHAEAGNNPVAAGVRQNG